MRVHDSFPLHEGASGELLCAKLLQKLMVKVRFWDALHILLRRVLTIQIRLQVLLNVAGEFGQNLASEHISVSLNLDLLLVLEVLETGVIVAPALPVEEEDFDLAVRVVIDDLGVLFTAHGGLFLRDLNFVVVRKVPVNS